MHQPLSSSQKKSGRSVNAKALADALSGVGAALVALWVFYPVDVWKTHVQAGRKPPPLRRMMSSGLETKSLHTASSSFFYFYLYSWILSSWTEWNAHSSSSPQKISASTRLLLSAVAAMLNTCLTLPLDVLSARHQTMIDPEECSDVVGGSENSLNSSSGDKASTNGTSCDTDLSVWRPFRESQRRWRNLQALWKGLNPSLILCTNPAINYTVFDTIKSKYTANRQISSLSSLEAFVLGLFSKFVATMATYPLIRAKVMLMVTSQRSMVQCLRDTYRAQGIQGLYEGCDLQLFHTLLKSALLMTVRERISQVTQQWIIGGSARQG